MDKKVIDQIIQFVMGLLGNAAQQKAAPAAPTQAPKKQVDPLTKDDLLMGRDKEYTSEYTYEISQNLDKLLIVMNEIQNNYGQKFKVNSGWRPAAVNSSTPGAAAHSKHMLGLAVDVADADGNIMKWVLENLELMKTLGVYFEDWQWTPTWTHFQLGAPKSGNRIFIPSTAPALAPGRWAGKYNAKYN